MECIYFKGRMVRGAALQRRAQCAERGGGPGAVEGVEGGGAVERAVAAGVWLLRSAVDAALSAPQRSDAADRGGTVSAAQADARQGTGDRQSLSRLPSYDSMGKLKKKVVPLPRVLSAPTVPLCRWMSFFTMANPSPVDFSPPVGFALNR